MKESPQPKTSREKKAEKDAAYKKAKQIRDKIAKGIPTTFQERTIMRIIDKKLKKEKREKEQQRKLSN